MVSIVPTVTNTSLTMSIAEHEGSRKDTGLIRGQAKAIAAIHRVSITHVLEVAKGNRPGRPALLKTIESYRERNAVRGEYAGN
jgi:hypothetical protein